MWETIKKLQAEIDAWATKNFGKRLPYQPLLGIQEEVGELSHSFLKKEQGIRGTAEEHDAGIYDAVGDIFIYLCDFCNCNGIDLSECVEQTWLLVCERDWKANSLSGTPEKDK